jgi:iron(III) transport system ATP-binding protein
VPSGPLLAILGGSGSGKTTLLRFLNGFEHADSESIEIGEREMSGKGVHVSPARQQVGYVAQEGSLFPHLTVGENVVFGLSRYDRRGQRQCGSALESVGLPASYKLRPRHELSGGEQQRVAPAGAHTRPSFSP